MELQDSQYLPESSKVTSGAPPALINSQKNVFPLEPTGCNQSSYTR